MLLDVTWVVLCLVFFNSTAEKGEVHFTMTHEFGVQAPLTISRGKINFDNTRGKEKVHIQMTQTELSHNLEKHAERATVEILARFDLKKIYFLNSKNKEYSEAPWESSLASLIKGTLGVVENEESVFLMSKIDENKYTYYNKTQSCHVNRIKDRSLNDLVTSATVKMKFGTIRLSFSPSKEKPTARIFEIPEGYTRKK